MARTFIILSFIIFFQLSLEAKMFPSRCFSKMEVQQLVNNNTDSIEYAKRLLLENGIVRGDFPEDKIIAFQELYYSDKSIGLIQIEYNENEGWNEEPNYNILFKRDFNGLFCYEIIPSAYPEDFTVYFRSEDCIIFEYYSSSVGYSQFYIYQKENDEFYLTSKFDEAEKLYIKEIDIINGLVGNKEISLFEINNCN